MIPSKSLLPFLLLPLALFSLALPLHADSLSIDTDYRLRGIDYTNTDFDNSSSTDAASYYGQRLRLTITGKFAQGIEIGTRISAVGVAGSTSTLTATPYPRTDFTPFVETAYLRMNGVAELPVDIIAGRQNMEYGDGLIVSDNGVGFTGIRIIGYFMRPVPGQAELFTAKIKDNFRPSTDMDVYGGVGSFKWKDHQWELGYFQETDKSGTPYVRGATTYPTTSIVKQFYDLRVGRKLPVASYQFEVAKQIGSVTRATDGAGINLDGLGYVASGELIGEKTKLGRVAAHALIAIFSGEANPGSFTDDASFSPDLTRRFDGTERTGYGTLFAATPVDSFFTTTYPSAFTNYSGLDTLNVGANFTPYYGWLLGVDYFLFSASQGPKGAPTASGFERLFGAEFTLGVELDLAVKYTYSKYVDFKFIYSRYTPPKFETFWPKSDPATGYTLEVSAKF